MGYLAHCVAMEEISRASASVGLVLRRAFQSVRQPDPPQRHAGAEAALSAQADQRRACRRAGDERAGRGLGRGRRCELRAEKRGDRYVLNGTKCGSPTGRTRTCWWSTRRPTPEAGPRGITAFLVEKRVRRVFLRAEAGQARHARLQHRRTGVRGLRGAGGERAGRGGWRRRRADERARLRARGAGGGAARHHAGVPGRRAALRA